MSGFQSSAGVRDSLPALGEQACDVNKVIRRRMFWFGIAFIGATAPIYLLIAILGNVAITTLLPLVCIYAWIAVTGWTTPRHGDYLRGLQWLHTGTFLGVLLLATNAISVNTGAFWWLSVIPIATILGGMTGLGIVQGVIVVAYACVAFFINDVGSIDASQMTRLRLHLGVALSTIYVVAYLALATIWRARLRVVLDAAISASTAAIDAKARFLANMSHEIRTPLVGILGVAELLRSDATSGTRRDQLISLQEQSTKALLALVNDVLDWAKLDVGKVNLASESFSLRELVFDANELFAVGAFGKGIELTSSCSPDVPRHFVGDAPRIRQVINNLVGNAVKFTNRGGIHIHLGLESEPPTDGARTQRRWVRIEVSDSGIGIPPGQLTHVFDAFVQADSSISRQHGGTGLGLAICRDLAQLMGGRLEVVSTVGEGSTFSFTVPLLIGDNEDQPLPTARRRDIVVASSNVGLIRHMTSLLNELGHEPDVRSSLALDTHDLGGRRLLLVDAPLLSSLEDPDHWMAQKRSSGLRVVVLSPLTSPGAVAGAGTLHKPIRPDALAEVLSVGVVCSESPTLTTGVALPSPRVLLCDDNPVNQIVVQAMLGELDAECVIACDGQQALAYMESERFDLVLMDVQMPELDGLEATSRRRELDKAAGVHTPIVGITAQAEGTDRESCRRAGMDGILSKPFTIEDLRTTVQRYAARRSSANHGQQNGPIRESVPS